jgi:hypothetical protein
VAAIGPARNRASLYFPKVAIKTRPMRQDIDGPAKFVPFGTSAPASEEHDGRLSTTDCRNRRVYLARPGDRREPPQREAATASRPPERKAKPEAAPCLRDAFTGPPRKVIGYVL